MLKNAVGLIALDIDGTITADRHTIPENVIFTFNSLYQLGWRFIFITGRTFDFAQAVLDKLPFNYFCAVQNGAILLEMPQQTILSKKYINKSMIPSIESICKEEFTDFIVFSGMEYDNQCFYHPDRFSSELLSFFEKRCLGYGETWTSLNSFDELPMDEFPSIKCFGKLESAQRLSQKLEERLNLHAPVITDPFNDEFYIVQATHPDVSKGQALSDLIDLFDYKGKTIAAGDDLNDLSMLKRADFSIAMGTAPDIVKQAAAFIAPSAQEEGIIQGLKNFISLQG